jgi:hypothetical protein
MPYVNLRVERYALYYNFNTNQWERTGEYDYDVSEGTTDPDIYYIDNGDPTTLSGLLYNATRGQSTLSRYNVSFYSDPLQYTRNTATNYITASVLNTQWLTLTQWLVSGSAHWQRQWIFKKPNGTVTDNIVADMAASTSWSLSGDVYDLMNAYIAPGSQTAEMEIGQMWSIGEYTPSTASRSNEFHLYVRVVNDLPPIYIPMQGKENNTWKTCNITDGLQGKKNNSYITAYNKFVDDVNEQTSTGKEANGYKRLQVEV